MWTSLLANLCHQPSPEVRIVDYRKQEGRVPFLNEARFKKKLRKWYNLTDEVCEKQ